MEKDLIRLLKAEEIECRIAAINEKGLSLLLYKDARVDQRILDETFGAFGWKRSHQCIDGNLYCTVEIFNKEAGEWISKQDVGTTGYTEKEKSQASDSFKRACFNWGIGRELYTAPFIWLPAAKAGIQKKGDRYVSNERFTVKSISYNGNREIISLEVTDSKGHVVYCLQEEGGGSGKVPRSESGNAGAAQRTGNGSSRTAPRMESGNSGTVSRSECDDSGTASKIQGGHHGIASESDSSISGAMPKPRNGRSKAAQEQDKTERTDGQSPAQPQDQETVPTAGQTGRQQPGSKPARNGEGGISSTQEIVLMAELNRTGVTLDEVLKRYKLEDISQMTQETYKRALAALRQTKPKGTAA